MFTNIDLSLNKILGEGGYGTVYEGVWRKKPVAIKRIHLLDIASIEREEEALRKLDHPNVIRLLHVQNDSTFR
jgi:serine/threonine-protein kinase/endoribonuclease IRE1